MLRLIWVSLIMVNAKKFVFHGEASLAQVQVSSTLSGWSKTAHMFDGNMNNMWHSYDTNPYVRVIFNTPKTISKIIMGRRNGHTNRYKNLCFILLGVRNGQTLTEPTHFISVKALEFRQLKVVM